MAFKLLLVSVFLVLSDGSSFLCEHQFCKNGQLWHKLQCGPGCMDTDYITKIKKELNASAVDNIGTSPANYRISVLNAILSLYDDLRQARAPTIVNLDSHYHNSTKQAIIHPISSCIPEEYIIKEVTGEKNSAFGHSTSRIHNATHLHLTNLSHTLDQIERSYFVIAQKNTVGWDVPKNLEILAYGSLPLYFNLRQCPHSALTAHPKQLYQYIMSMPGLKLGTLKRSGSVTAGLSIRHEHLKCNLSAVDKGLYSTVIASLLQYTRNVLTTKAMAAYLLNTILNDNPQFKMLDLNSNTPLTLNVLYLSYPQHQTQPQPQSQPQHHTFSYYNEQSQSRYALSLADLILHGLISLLRGGNNNNNNNNNSKSSKSSSSSSVTDFPRRQAVYFDLQSSTSTTTAAADKSRSSTGGSDQKDRKTAAGTTWNLQVVDLQQQSVTSRSGENDNKYMEEVRAGIAAHTYDLVLVASDHHKDELRNISTGTAVVTNSSSGSSNSNSYSNNSIKSGGESISISELYGLVCRHYHPQRVAFIDGSEHHLSKKLINQLQPCVGHFFSREGYSETTPSSSSSGD